MRRKKGRFLKILLGLLAVAPFALGASLFFTEAPSGPLVTTVDIERKMILDETAADTAVSAASPSPARTALENLKEFASALPALANPSVEYVRISPGMRKEEVLSLLGKKLKWTDVQKEEFLSTAVGSTDITEGVFYPGVYLLPRGADGESVGEFVAERFEEKVAARYASSTKKAVSLETALKIASIIEREAGRRDMHLVSGVIWNRLFREMSLDMDATLQYVKGNEKIGWWPKVLPQDKFIKSPFNTYLYEGLPPAPISNPSIASVEAALNPKKTEYLYYLHDRYGNFRGAKTYKEHLKNIERYLK